tara:strand:- start:4938 stop:5546 length:609 start_codon:yes stop_codon:yes gene_type:complete
MLNSKTIIRLKRIGKRITEAQDAFIDACEQALEDLAGKEWRKNDLPPLFRQLDKELRAVLCLDEEGPKLSNNTFRVYMTAAKKAILFEIPFRMAYAISYDDIPKVLDMINKDKRKIKREVKVDDAIRELRQQKRRNKESIDAGFLRIPRPTIQCGQEWVDEFLGVISQALSFPQAKTLAIKNQDMKKLVQIVKAYRKKRDAA